MPAAVVDVAPEELEGLRCLGRGGDPSIPMAVFRRVAALAGAHGRREHVEHGAERR